MLDDKHVFVVEGDRDLAGEISHELRSRGYSVSATAIGDEAVRAARSDRVSALIVDRALGGHSDGLTLVEKLRDEGIKTPVLVIGGLSSVDERIKGLTAGADDCLSPPFEMRELGARVDSLVRRLGDIRATSLRAGDVTLNLVDRTVTRASRLIELLPREFKLLEYFVRRPNQIITRTMLLEQVWNYSLHTQTNVVDVHIGQLRRKMEAPGEGRIIINVRGEGFMFHVEP